MAQTGRRLPNVLTPTADLTREEWLAFRRKGIGGSDAAAVMGISPFRTGLDLYYDKLGLPVEDNEDNWVAMEMGNLLEDLVARIFAKKTGLTICPMKFMFQHPDHPWMLADLDRLVNFPDGSTAILEIKTTNYNARDKWEYDGKPIVPPYYEAQGRHYMAVLDLNRVYYCCLYGNNEDEVIIASHSFLFLSSTLVGGSGSLAGPILGTALLTILPESLRFAATHQNGIYGVLVAIVILFLPTGLYGGVNQLIQKVKAKKNMEAGTNG